MGAEDAIKDEVKWRYGFQLIQETMEEAKDHPEKKKKKRARKKAKSEEPKPDSDKPKMTKLERKLKFKEYTKMMKEAWSSLSGEDTEEELGVTVPDGLKKYTIEDRKIIMQKPIRQKPDTPGVSYDGPEDAKQINLANEGEEQRMVWIATNLASDEEQLLIQTLKDHKDVFAWSYKDLKGVALTSVSTQSR